MKLKKLIALFTASMMVCLTNSAANAEENESLNVSPIAEVSHGGTLMKDAITGEVTYIPDDYTTTSFFNEFDDLSEYCSDSMDSLGISPQAVIGSDDRKKINTPYTSTQYRSTVLIETKTADGGDYRGSGFMIGPNAVATSGHVVFAHDHGGDGWITYAKVTPAFCTEVAEPYYGYAEAIAYQCGWNFANGKSADDDWGIIILNSNIGNKTGWFKPTSLSYSTSYYNKSVNLNGYPTDVRGESVKDLYWSRGTILEATARTLTSYDLDASGGDSGGPCYYLDANVYRVIGIMRGGGTKVGKEYSDFLRIDDWLRDKFISFETSTLN